MTSDPAQTSAHYLPSSQPTPPRLFESASQGRQAAWLALLMILAGLTEGFGIVLLVPLLSALGETGGGRIATALSGLGLPTRLDLLLALFVAVALFRSAIVHQRALAAQQFEHDLIDRLRGRAWAALLRCDWRVLMGMRRSNTASLLISRVDQVGVYVNQGLQALATLVTLGGIGLAALTISPLMSAAALVLGSLVMLAFHSMRRRAAILGEQLGLAYADIHSQLDEGLSALRPIKSLGREDAVNAGLAHQFSRLRKAQIAYQRDLGLGQMALQGGGAAVFAVLIWLALERWHFDIAVILPILALLVRSLPLLGNLQQAALACAHSRPAAADALALIVQTEAAHEPGQPGLAPPTLYHAIRLEDATVRFAGTEGPALNSISASIPARGITAIVGPSGAGKSTLADLIGGLLSPDSGAVLIDGVRLEGPLRQAWRSRVAYVQQDPVLLSASLRDNLRWAAPDASDAQLRTALEAASAGFAAALPQGLDTLLGDGGRALSGGERQRLMLARALLRDPALLILDEATSALDAENEAAIAEALVRLKERMAVVVIGHRGALPLLADHTIRLKQGRCVDPAERTLAPRGDFGAN